jgi:hypothetical protein
MSYRVKNLTIENGFARNPDRVYYEEYFDSLPQNFVSFTLTASDNTDDHVFQPANTFLTGAYLIGKSGSNIVLVASSDVGISLSHTGVQAVGSGNIISGSATNILNNSGNGKTTLGGNNILASFADVINGIDSYSSTKRTLYLRVTTSGAISSGATNPIIFVPIFSTPGGDIVKNNYFTLQGTGFPTIEYDSNYSGVKLTTDASTTSSQGLIFTDSSAHNNPVSNGGLKTNTLVEFETSITLPSVAADFSLIAGLKLTNTPLITTDANQAMFIFGQDEPLVDSANLASNATLHFVYSVAGSDYITNLGLTMVADREYHLKIVINKQRKISIYVNGIQYGLTSTAYSSGNYGNNATNAYDESVALSDSISLYPMIGVQNSDANTNARSVFVSYVKCSRRSRKTLVTI